MCCRVYRGLRFFCLPSQRFSNKVLSIFIPFLICRLYTYVLSTTIKQALSKLSEKITKNIKLKTTRTTFSFLWLLSVWTDDTFSRSYIVLVHFAHFCSAKKYMVRAFLRFLLQLYLK